MKEEKKLTRILGIVTGMAENFKRTDEIEGVQALVESEKDLDGLGHAAITVLCDCTHRAGIVVGLVGMGIESCYKTQMSRWREKKEAER